MHLYNELRFPNFANLPQERNLKLTKVVCNNEFLNGEITSALQKAQMKNLKHVAIGQKP